MYEKNRIEEILKEETTEEDGIKFADVSVEFLMFTIEFLVLITARKEMGKTLSRVLLATTKLTDSITARKDGTPTISERMVVDGVIDIAENIAATNEKMEAMTLLILHHQKLDETGDIDEMLKQINREAEG